MKILIYGASGATGHELVRQALADGNAVTAFVRDPVKLKVQHPNLETVKGNVIDYEKVEEAVKGKDAVLSALGASSPFKFDQTIVDGTENIIKAMEKNNVSRFIYMSFVGVRESRHCAGFVIKYIAPKLLSTEIDGHEKREMMIKQSKLTWTIVRAPTLTNGKHISKFRSGLNISSKGFVVSISRADVAEFMLKQLNEREYYKKAPLILY